MVLTALLRKGLKKTLEIKILDLIAFFFWIIHIKLKQFHSKFLMNFIAPHHGVVGRVVCLSLHLRPVS